MVRVCAREPSAVWVENAIVTPLEHNVIQHFSGAVYSVDGSLCELSLRPSEKTFFKHLPDSNHHHGPYEFLQGTFLYGGIIFGLFGHDLFEMPTRLWPIIDGQIFDGVVFHSRKPNIYDMESTSATVRHVLHCFGISRERAFIVDKMPFQVERLLVPEICFKIDDYSLPAAQTCYDWIREKTDETSKVPVHERVYLSRAKLTPGRTFEHERLIQEAAHDAGFAIIHPQELPIPVQIKMMDHSRIVSGLDGSAMHLIAFAREGTIVVCFDARKIANASQIILEQLIHAKSIHLYVGDKSELEIRDMLRQFSSS